MNLREVNIRTIQQALQKQNEQEKWSDKKKNKKS